MFLPSNPLRISFGLLLALFCSLWQTAYATDVEGKVFWNDVCRSSAELGHAKVILDNGRLSGSVQKDGSFVIPDVPEGSYILSVLARGYSFDTFRVDIIDPSSPPEIRTYLPGTPHDAPLQTTSKSHLHLYARHKANYFIEHEGFSVMTMLKNPMIMMMVGTGALMLGMPYMMKNLDPEIAKEVGERQAKMANIQSSLQSGDLSGLSAFLVPQDNTPAPGPAKKPESKGRAGTPKGKRR